MSKIVVLSLPLSLLPLLPLPPLLSSPPLSLLLVSSIDTPLLQVQNEKARENESRKLFFTYAKSWWSEYCQLGTKHPKRRVAMSAVSEHGVDLPVCSFVRPMKAGRLLDSARHAARFVSLFDFADSDSFPLPSSGEASSDVWCSVHTFLSRGKGMLRSVSPVVVVLRSLFF